MRLLFIINPRSGKEKIDQQSLIRDFYKDSGVHCQYMELTEDCKKEDVQRRAKQVNADRVVAVGGDGTVKFVAECFLNSDIPIGIIPGGSANGMAKELKIPLDLNAALQLLKAGREMRIHVVKVNEELCIHLADIGFNAFTVKKFEAASSRGMWGYIKAAFKVLWRNPHMKVLIQTDKEVVNRNAAMVVIANATQYGTGVVINPEGKLTDQKFEIVIVKKISIRELFKMRVTQRAFDPVKTEVFQTSSVEITSMKRVHFQVDGEYLGKLHKIEARLIPDAVTVVVPDNELPQS